MIINLATCCMLAFLNPADPSGKTIYPSGIKDADSKIFSAPKSTKLPILTLSVNIKDKNENIVPPGFYKASISQDDKYILLFQNNYIAGVLKINNLKHLDKNVAMNSVVVKFYNKKSVLIIVKQDNKEAESSVGICF
ncbi:MAG: hypothetical protein WC197_06355 [Candidatus Gastranaerophilaceae bacterium]|jgi:hypothetical protein